MKKILLVSVVLFVFVAMVSCAGMYTGQKVFRARGTVAAYEPGKMISLHAGMAVLEVEGEYGDATPSAPPEVFAYAITPSTELKGEIKPGTRVLIRYTQMGKGDGAQKTAVTIDPLGGK
jgi:hypothetical protein